MGIFAEPRTVTDIKECTFYHTMDIPGHGTVEGEWDLRANLDKYFGSIDLNNMRILEIGPASGYLTFEMEKRGARVDAVEVTDEHGWDFVPYPEKLLNKIKGPREETMRRLKNSFWFMHAAYNSKARIHYGDIYNLPTEIGHYDAAMMLAVLLHVQNPLQVVMECAKRTDTLVITDLLYPDLEGKGAIAKLMPTKDNQKWDTWWQFSTEYFLQVLGVMGFTHTKVTTHTHLNEKKPNTFFTIVASRQKQLGNA